ncbi:DUF58 domain-containing protein [Leptospira idonii]|uniref:DUF58 domain-containing protein n=1 Tax=Leptospira idonii TaxID=1193500 RepID=A0A4V3JYA0_9LEPT|nr:DUF58 domain-containing protein [Leptospira idonii]TGN19716.1 DUF58 domain-containing protein [Leptospira idonii]
MLDPDLKKLLNVLDWETKKKFRSFRSGGFHQSSRGKGLEFKEVRPYTYGDDTRYIDWNVTSRTGEVHVKEFYEDQDVPIFLFIDCSQSMKGNKERTAYQLAFFLSLFHIKIGNRIRVFLFGENIYHSGKELKREEDVYQEFKSLPKHITTTSGIKTDFNQAIEFGFKISSRFTTAYWLSDFAYFDGFPSYKGIFGKWEHYGIWIEEKVFESELPFWFRIFSFIDSETKKDLKNFSNLPNDLSAFRSCFGIKRVTVRPEMKLSGQILELFRGVRV